MHVVIGGSDGLGKEIIDSLNDLGLETTNISRRRNSSARQNIECDLSTKEGIQIALKELRSIKKPLEAIYISVGVFSFQNVSELDADEFERVFAINTRAPFLLISSLLDRIKTEGTDLIFINSVAGIRSYKNQTFYNASKAALHSFTNDLRSELSETNARVVGVYPGMIDTDLAQKLPSGPLTKSKHAMINPKVLADYIVYTQQLPKSIEVSDIITDRKKHAKH